MSSIPLELRIFFFFFPLRFWIIYSLPVIAIVTGTTGCILSWPSEGQSYFGFIAFALLVAIGLVAFICWSVLFIVTFAFYEHSKIRNGP